MLKISRFPASAVGGFALASALLALPGAAAAEVASSTLSVSAKVTAKCTVSTNALAFGNVDTLSGSDVDGTGGIIVTCTNGTSWSATAGVGAGSGASYALRRMTSGGDVLGYNLYTNSGRTTVWGDGSGSTAAIAGTGTGAAQNVTIYGRVGLGQTGVPAGDYSDTVSVTVTY